MFILDLSKTSAKATTNNR